jgi:hypothetical protein
MPEKRGYKRFKIQGRAILKWTDGVARSIDVELFDISFLGVCVVAQEKIEAGIDVDFELKFSFSPKAMFGKGKVKTSLEIKRDDAKVFRMGIDFFDVDKGALASFLACIAADIRKKEQKKKQAGERHEF